MHLILFLIFVAVPLIELALIIKVGQLAGFWPTLGLIVGTALLGTVLLNRQGMSVLRRVSAALDVGKPPVGAVLDGAFLFMAGLLMITPGFLTDLVGLVLLIPPLRRPIARHVLSQMLGSGEIHVRGYEWRGGAGAEEGGPQRRPRPGPDGNVVIETDYERIDEPATDQKPRRPADSED